MPKANRGWLAVGVVAWCVGVALTPGEIASAKRHAPISPRTAATLIAYLVGVLGVLQGLAPKRDGA